MYDPFYPLLNETMEEDMRSNDEGRKASARCKLTS